MKARVMQYYVDLLARRAEPVASHWRRGVRPAPASAAVPAAESADAIDDIDQIDPTEDIEPPEHVEGEVEAKTEA